jgi:hypothetical protein
MIKELEAAFEAEVERRLILNLGVFIYGKLLPKLRELDRAIDDDYPGLASEILNGIIKELGC